MKNSVAAILGRDRAGPGRGPVFWDGPGRAGAAQNFVSIYTPDLLCNVYSRGS